MSPKLLLTYPHTYRKRPGNYYGSTIFEIDIVKSKMKMEVCYCDQSFFQGEMVEFDEVKGCFKKPTDWGC